MQSLRFPLPALRVNVNRRARGFTTSNVLGLGGEKLGTSMGMLFTLILLGLPRSSHNPSCQPHIQRRFVPQDEDSLVRPISRLLTQLHVKVPEHASQYRTHLRVRQILSPSQRSSSRSARRTDSPFLDSRAAPERKADMLRGRRWRNTGRQANARGRTFVGV